jgi:hypothetical protein
MLPDVGIVIGALVSPGAMEPALNAPESAVGTWTTLSAFLHATDWPALTDAGFGENELPPFMPVMVIVTSAVAPGVGEGVGDGDEGLAELLPQAAVKTSAARPRDATDRRTNPRVMIFLLGRLTGPLAA